MVAFGGLEADQPRGVAQVIGRAEIVVEADLVGHVTDPALHHERLAHRIMPEHPDLPGRNLREAEHHQDSRGLAGTIRTQKPEDFAARDRERDGFDDPDAIVDLGQAFGLDDVLAHRRPYHITAPTVTSSAPPMSAMPTMP